MHGQVTFDSDKESVASSSDENSESKKSIKRNSTDQANESNRWLFGMNESDSEGRSIKKKGPRPK